MLPNLLMYYIQIQVSLQISISALKQPINYLINCLLMLQLIMQLLMGQLNGLQLVDQLLSKQEREYKIVILNKNSVFIFYYNRLNQRSANMNRKIIHTFRNQQKRSLINDPFIRMGVLQAKIQRQQYDKNEIAIQIDGIKTWKIQISQYYKFMRRVLLFSQKIGPCYELGQCLLNILQLISNNYQSEQYRITTIFLIIKNYEYIESDILEGHCVQAINSMKDRLIKYDDIGVECVIMYCKITQNKQQFTVVHQRYIRILQDHICLTIIPRIIQGRNDARKGKSNEGGQTSNSNTKVDNQLFKKCEFYIRSLFRLYKIGLCKLQDGYSYNSIKSRSQAFLQALKQHDIQLSKDSLLLIREQEQQFNRFGRAKKNKTTIVKTNMRHQYIGVRIRKFEQNRSSEIPKVNRIVFNQREGGTTRKSYKSLSNHKHKGSVANNNTNKDYQRIYQRYSSQQNKQQPKQKSKSINKTHKQSKKIGFTCHINFKANFSYNSTLSTPKNRKVAKLYSFTTGKFRNPCFESKDTTNRDISYLQDNFINQNTYHNKSNSYSNVSRVGCRDADQESTDDTKENKIKKMIKCREMNKSGSNNLVEVYEKGKKGTKLTKYNKTRKQPKLPLNIRLGQTMFNRSNFNSLSQSSQFQLPRLHFQSQQQCNQHQFGLNLEATNQQLGRCQEVRGRLEQRTIVEGSMDADDVQGSRINVEVDTSSQAKQEQQIHINVISCSLNENNSFYQVKVNNVNSQISLSFDAMANKQTTGSQQQHGQNRWFSSDNQQYRCSIMPQLPHQLDVENRSQTGKLIESCKQIKIDTEEQLQQIDHMQMQNIVEEYFADWQHTLVSKIGEQAQSCIDRQQDMLRRIAQEQYSVFVQQICISYMQHRGDAQHESITDRQIKEQNMEQQRQCTQLDSKDMYGEQINNQGRVNKNILMGKSIAEYIPYKSVTIEGQSSLIVDYYVQLHRQRGNNQQCMVATINDPHKNPHQIEIALRIPFDKLQSLPSINHQISQSENYELLTDDYKTRNSTSMRHSPSCQQTYSHCLSSSNSGLGLVRDVDGVDGSKREELLDMIKQHGKMSLVVFGLWVKVQEQCVKNLKINTGLQQQHVLSFTYAVYQVFYENLTFQTFIHIRDQSKSQETQCVKIQHQMLMKFNQLNSHDIIKQSEGMDKLRINSTKILGHASEYDSVDDDYKWIKLPVLKLECYTNLMSCMQTLIMANIEFNPQQYPKTDNTFALFNVKQNPSVQQIGLFIF